MRSKLTFDEAFDLILDTEGSEFVNHRNDPGGKTKFGITERYHPEYWKDGPPTLEDAERFYRSQWDTMLLGQVNAYCIAHELFDTATLHGPRRAVLFLQTAFNYWANIHKKRGKFIPLLKEDGELGPVTLAAINRFCDKDSSTIALYTMMNHLQANRIMSQESPDFQLGWFANRICGLLKTGGV